MGPRLILSVALLAALLIAGCSGGDDGSPTATAVLATPTVESEATETATIVPPTVTPTPSEPVDVPSTVWLMDMRDGKVITIYESHEVQAISAFFLDGHPVVLANDPDGVRQAIEYDVDGNEIGSEAWGIWPHCQDVDGGAEVSGRFHAEAACGPLSPDGEWMTYWIEDGGEIEMAPGFKLPSRTRWAVNIETDERVVLQDHLAQCQGDSFFWPAWSPSGRYVTFGDCAEGGRVFLSDVATGETRQIASASRTFEPSQPGHRPPTSLRIRPRTAQWC